MSTNQEKHKSGPLKQSNKPHKHGRHRTKGQIENANKGKVDVKVLSKKNKNLDKKQRRHQAKQIRKNKREEVLEKKRKIGTERAPPHIIAVFPLSNCCNCEEVIEHIIKSDDSIVSIHKSNMHTIISTRHRQRFTILNPNAGDLFSILDAGKVADSFLFIVPASGVFDDYNKKWLTYLMSQGLPATVLAIQGLKHVPVNKQSERKKTIHKQMNKWFPKEIKLHSIDSDQDAGIILRLLANQKQKTIHYKENRPYLLAEKMEFETETPGLMNGTLKVTGFIRGKPLSVNRLVHLPGLGECQMKQIDLPNDPYKIGRKKDSNSNNMDEDAEGMEEGLKTIAVADPNKQTSLTSEAEVDPMDAEQTWPTEDELKAADEAAAMFAEEDDKSGRTLKKVPKGTSEYQASWIVDEEEEDDEEDSEDDDDDDSDDGMEAVDDEESENEEEQEFDTISVAATTIANDERYDEQLDMDEEQRQLEKYRMERENEMFPDEVDTPMHVPARERFQRYRGLQSFRTSPWDPKENLPLDYARIFQFQNFNRTKKKVLKDNDEELEIEGAQFRVWLQYQSLNKLMLRPPQERDAILRRYVKIQAGWYVTIHIANVPKVYVDNWKETHPLVVFGLLPHEQKMTVMNFAIKRHPTSEIPVKAKDRLIFHVGFRRFIACPTFSHHTTGSKFKGERFLPYNGVVVATVYAPITFPPAPVLVFTENHDLVATGTCLGSNPNRVVVKKIVLSGHPYKIHKKSSVVRYMFFNRDDILWFKPVELFTKYGRRGHIKEPLGTHGHMKCVFDGSVKAQDTICMNLYKRIYPKWIYDPCVTAPPEVHTEKITEIQHEGDEDM